MSDVHYSTYRNGKFIDVPPIDNLCLALKDKFEKQEEENNRLKEENEKLKTGLFEKEEMARLKNEYNKMLKDCIRGFPISEEEQETIEHWKEQHELEKHNLKTFNQWLAFQGVSGGRYTYVFTPTAIGIVGEVKCTCGDSFEFQSL